MRTKALKTMNLLKELAHTSWGHQSKITIITLQGNSPPHTRVRQPNMQFS